jgi:signal transduction histidine kinase
VTLAEGVDGVLLSVMDTGSGMDEKQVTRIFNPFYSTKIDGMGMGLAICRTCVEAFGGRIWASSAPGKGTVIHVLIPALG